MRLQALLEVNKQHYLDRLSADAGSETYECETLTAQACMHSLHISHACMPLVAIDVLSVTLKTLAHTPPQNVHQHVIYIYIYMDNMLNLGCNGLFARSRQLMLDRQAL